jgi:hypothetical protein
MIECLMLIRDFDFNCGITLSRSAINQDIDWLISITLYAAHCADALIEIVTGLPFFENIFRLLEGAPDEAARIRSVWFRTTDALHRHAFTQVLPMWPGDVLAFENPELYASARLIDPPLH